MCVCCWWSLWCLDFLARWSPQQWQRWQWMRIRNVCHVLFKTVNGGIKGAALHRESTPAFYCTPPVNIGVMIEDVFWPLKPTVLSESHSALGALPFAWHKKITTSFVYNNVIHIPFPRIKVTPLCVRSSGLLCLGIFAKSNKYSYPRFLVNLITFLVASYKVQMQFYSWNIEI